MSEREERELEEFWGLRQCKEKWLLEHLQRRGVIWGLPLPL